jgi:hypothetical protein
MWLARWARVLVPDQTYNAGNDAWPFQLVLIAWLAASATVLGVAAAGPVVQYARWRYAVIPAASLCALAPLRIVSGWASGASAVNGDPAAGAAGAVLLGALVGAGVATAVLAWRGVGRCAAVWVGWVWLTLAAEVASYEPYRPGRDYVVPVDPLGMLTPRWPGQHNLVLLAALLSALLPAALLSWWAGRRRDPAPLLGVIVGPLLLIAVHLVVPPLPGGRGDGDHYSLQGDVSAWLLVCVLGLGVGALGLLAGRVRVRRRRPVDEGR